MKRRREKKERKKTVSETEDVRGLERSKPLWTGFPDLRTSPPSAGECRRIPSLSTLSGALEKV